MIPTDPLDQVATLLSSASKTPTRDARAVYLAVARGRLEAVAERVRELRVLLDALDGGLATAPAQQTTILTEPR